jgi:hypothetical protein
MDYVTVKTVKDGYERTVTIAHYDKTQPPQLLGALSHLTTIIIDQELIDTLQSMLDTMKEA